MVGYVVLPHIHNVVHLVGNLSGGSFLIRAQAASAQSTARSRVKQPLYLSARLCRLGCRGQPRGTGDTQQQESVTGEERMGNASPPCNHLCSQRRPRDRQQTQPHHSHLNSTFLIFVSCVCSEVQGGKTHTCLYNEQFLWHWIYKYGNETKRNEATWEAL